MEFKSRKLDIFITPVKLPFVNVVSVSAVLILNETNAISNYNACATVRISDLRVRGSGFGAPASRLRLRGSGFGPRTRRFGFRTFHPSHPSYRSYRPYFTALPPREKRSAFPQLRIRLGTNRSIKRPSKTRGMVGWGWGQLGGSRLRQAWY